MVLFKYNALVGSDMSGEYHETGGYSCSILRNEKDLFNNYYILLEPKNKFKFGESGWIARIYLSIQCSHSTAELIDQSDFHKITEAKDYISNFVYNFDSNNAFDYLQNWKKQHCKPTFFNGQYIGDTYYGYTHKKDDNDKLDYWDYFNDHKIDYKHGIYYCLDIINDKLVCFKETITSGSYTGESIKDIKILQDLLSKIKYLYLQGFNKDLFERFIKLNLN